MSETINYNLLFSRYLDFYQNDQQNYYSDKRSIDNVFINHRTPLNDSWFDHIFMANDIFMFTNKFRQEFNSFDISATIDQKKINVLYDGSQDSTQPSDIWGNW